MVNNWIDIKKGEINMANQNIDCNALNLFISFNWRNIMILTLDNNNLTT